MKQQQERIKGYVAGRRSVDGVSTWAIWVNQAGHPLDGKKLVVHSIGPDVYTLGKGDNITFELLRKEPDPDGKEGVQAWESADLFMAAHVFRDAGRTLNWFERIVLDYRTKWDDVGFGFYVIFGVMIAVCAGMFLYSYYTLSPRWFGGYDKGAFEKVMGVMFGWTLTTVALSLLNVSLWDALVGRLQQILDYSRRNQYTSIWLEVVLYTALAVEFAVIFYYGDGAFNGFADWTGWFMTVIVKYLITFMLAFPVVATAFLAVTAPWSVRDKSKLMFATN